MRLATIGSFPREYASLVGKRRASNCGLGIRALHPAKASANSWVHVVSLAKSGVSDIRYLMVALDFERPRSNGGLRSTQNRAGAELAPVVDSSIGHRFGRLGSGPKGEGSKYDGRRASYFFPAAFSIGALFSAATF